MKGLTTQQVEESKRKYGENVIEEAKPETFWDKLKNQLEDPMIRLLIVIAIIMSIIAIVEQSGDWTDPLGILFALVLVLFFGVKSEMDSDKAYRKLKKEIKKDTCKVYRDGGIVELPVTDIVVGDVIAIQVGDKIPADGFLVDGTMKVDNSSLNGESEECKKIAHEQGIAVEEGSWHRQITGDTFVDNHSLFSGANVVEGGGTFKVMRVGMNTVMGEMAKDMASEEVDSPLKVKLSTLAHQISIFGYVGAVLIMIALLFSHAMSMGGFNQLLPHFLTVFLECLTTAVVIVVMAVPEGLPLMIEIVLMQNTKKLLDNNVLVRKPIGIETAGSLNILYSDKTGTITKGKLEVVRFFDGEAKETYRESKAIREMMDLCIGRNTSAMFSTTGEIIGGNATDKALMEFLTPNRFARVENLVIEKEQPFNSANKYSASQVQGKTYYKGAPERLLTKAKYYLDVNGKKQPLQNHGFINQIIDSLAEKSMRVLSFAYSDKPLVENELPDDLIIVGFVGIRDDVRQEAIEAIKEVQGAGIQVVMITGDRKETAVAIAKDCGLIQKETDIALTSEELNQLTDEEVKEKIPFIRVIARALPTDKSRMVRLSQELGLVTGMTGDGSNDSPALKRADVGFAMGSGTDIAKENGDIILLDDNFKSIKSTILYGRTIYKNIQKFIKFQLTINIAAVAICTVVPFLGMSQPLGVTHILWINLIMDGLGALALGSEPALKTYMKERPKKRTENIVSREMLMQILVAGIYVTVLSLMFLRLPFFIELFDSEIVNGVPELSVVHLTAYFSFFVLAAICNGFNVRSEGMGIFSRLKDNDKFLKVMGMIVIIQVVLTFVGGKMFSCTPLTLQQWIIVIGLAITIVPIDLLRKLITQLLKK